MMCPLDLGILGHTYIVRTFMELAGDAIESVCPASAIMVRIYCVYSQHNESPVTSLIVPVAMTAVRKEADASTAPFDEFTHGSKLIAAAPAPQDISPAEKEGRFAEVAAWRFMRAGGSENRGPWGLYWVPMSSGTKGDGTPFYLPDIDQLSEDIVDYWITAAGAAKHPAIRARYADLAWEIGRYLKRPQNQRPASSLPPISLAISPDLAAIAIDGYTDAVDSGLIEEEIHSWEFLARAIVLSLSIKDSARTQSAKDSLLAYHRKINDSGKKFMWWKVSDILDGQEKSIGLTPSELQEVNQGLERALYSTSDKANRDQFDPHLATGAADRLARRYGNDQFEKQRVIKRAAVAFEHMAAEAGGLVAVSWLEDLIPRYRDVGLPQDAARIEGLVRHRAQDAQAEMKKISVEVEVPPEAIKELVDNVIGSSLEEAFVRIGGQFTLKEQDTQKSMLSMVKDAPLYAMISQSILSMDGFTEAMIHSVEDDLEGRTLQHAAQNVSFRAPLLYQAFAGMKSKYGLDAETIVEHLCKSPWFTEAQRAILKEGVAAWIAEDFIKAIHILVPQVEVACRELLAKTRAMSRA